MYDTIAAQANILLCIVYFNRDFAIPSEAIGWSFGVLCFTLSTELVRLAKLRSSKTLLIPTLILGVCALFKGIYYLLVVENYFLYLICFVLLFVITLLQYASLTNLEFKGMSCFLRFIVYGFLINQLNCMVLANTYSFSYFMFTVPAHTTYQAWRLAYEIKFMTLENRAQYMTTAALLGKHDSTKYFLIFHLFSWAYIVLDVAYVSWTAAWPWVLAPAAIVMTTRFRTSSTIDIEAFCYLLLFIGLTIYGLI